MEVVIVNQDEVGALLPMRDCIEVMEQVFRSLADGECLLPLRQIMWLPERVGALGDILFGCVAGRESTTEITLFKSVGLAVEDLAAGWHVYKKALESGGGSRVEFGGSRRATH